MSNVLYPAALQGFLEGTIPMLSGDIRALLIDTTFYTYMPTDTFLSTIPPAAQVAASLPVSGKSTTNGVFDASGASFNAVSGASVEAFVLYLHTGAAATSRLIAFYDTNVAGLPLTPTGVPVAISWPGVPWFRIGGTCP